MLQTSIHFLFFFFWQNSYSVTYQSVSGNEESACQSIAQLQCTITVETDTYVPGTQFTVRVVANKGDFSSAAATTMANTSKLKSSL